MTAPKQGSSDAIEVFLDTSVLLEIYHLSGPDLDELRKIIKLAEKGKIHVLITGQVRDEFWRNRERVVRAALDEFAKTSANAVLPNLVRTYPDVAQLKQTVETVRSLVKTIKEAAASDAEGGTLKADLLIEELFEKFPPAEVAADVIDRARLRRELGNPPGKGAGIGDAVNWEWLLQQVPKNTDLKIISQDGDFESELIKEEVKEFLDHEWDRLNGGFLSLYTSLPDFLQDCFPDIKLADEIDKVMAVESLEQSSSFAATHNAIGNLAVFDDFSEDQLIRLLQAYTSNQQIHWILGDSDVHDFAIKLVSKAKTKKASEVAERLSEMLAQLEEKKAAKQKQKSSWFDDDSPF